MPSLFVATNHIFRQLRFSCNFTFTDQSLLSQWCNAYVLSYESLKILPHNEHASFLSASCGAKTYYTISPFYVRFPYLFFFLTCFGRQPTHNLNSVDSYNMLEGIMRGLFPPPSQSRTHAPYHNGYIASIVDKMSRQTVCCEKFSEIKLTSIGHSYIFLIFKLVI